MHVSSTDRARALLGCGLALCAALGAARAEPPSPCALEEQKAADGEAPRKVAKKIKKHLDQAQGAYDKQLYDQGIRELKAAYELHPVPDVLFNLAQTCRKAGYEKDALRLYQRTQKQSKDPTLVDSAKRHYFEILAKLAQPLEQKATVAFDNRRYDEAVAAWQAAYAINPGAFYQYRIAQARRLGGKLEEAQATYERFLKEEPKTELRKEIEGHLRTLRGQMEDARAGRLEEAGRHAEAAAAWEAAYQADAQPRYLFQRGQALRLGGQAAEAIAVYERFLKEDARTERRREVEGHLGKLRAQVLDREAAGHLEGKRYAQAAAAWDAAHRLDPAPRYQIERARAQELSGKPAEAAATYEQALRRLPAGALRLDAEDHLVAIRTRAAEARRAQAEEARRKKPIYKRWWFWTGIGAVVAAGVVAGVVVATQQQDDPRAGIPPANLRDLGLRIVH